MTRITFALALALWFATPAAAGPPFDTDDPEPTDVGKWEVYFAADYDGTAKAFDGAGTIELNYGAAEDLQLTAAIPLNYAFESGIGSSVGLGDTELAIKYRFYHDDASGFSLAAFPNITLPTASESLGAGRVTSQIPVWGQKDFGGWSVFGGGGYAINPGPRNLNYWYGGAAITNEVTDRLTVGIEATREGSVALDDRPTNTVALGLIYQLVQPYSLLMRGGPAWEDGGGGARYHLYLGLGLNF